MLSSLDIKTRFQNEQDYVSRYIGFLHGASAIHDSDIDDIINILHKHGLPQILQRRGWSKWSEPYSISELTPLVDALQMVLPDIDRRIVRLILKDCAKQRDER